MTLDVQLVGNAMQMAVATLRPGQTAYCEAGKFLFSSADVTMETRLTKPSNRQGGVGVGVGAGAGGGGRGGMFGGLLQGAMDAGKRMLAGESLAFQYFTTPGGDGLLAFAGVIPGEMRVLELDGRTTWFAEKDAFVAAETTVDFDIAFSGLRQGLSGGEGFILEKFTGVGSVVIAGAGNFIDINPADYGGRLRVDTGCIVAFDHNIRYGLERVGRLNGSGLMNMMLGGEGLNLATLEGNGRVILQSLTLDGLASALAKNAAHRSGGNDNGQTGLGALGGLFGSSD